jgi:uncharacterized membrane protein YbhN (UPF0104 family)
VQRVLDAIEVFFDHLTAVRFAPLAIAVALHLVKLACTSNAWRNVLAAAYPEVNVRRRSILGAYVSGVGVNAFVPARGGDAVRLLLAHRAVPGSTYTTLASSLVAMAIFDMAAAGALFAWALTQHVLPSLAVLPDLPSFDFAWFLNHPRASGAAGGALAVLTLVAAVWIHRRVREFRARIAQGVAVLRDPVRYLRSVAFWQACDWGLRLVTSGLFLHAFGIDPSLRNVLLVQVTGSLATLVPVSPAGIGTEQAFLVYVFKGSVAETALLAFSVGMKLTLVAVNVVAGFTALALTLRTFRVRRAVESAGPPPVEV